MKKWGIAAIMIVALIVFPGCATAGVLLGRTPSAQPTQEATAAVIPASHVTETQDINKVQVLDELQDRLAEIYDEVNPSVVSIQVTTMANSSQIMPNSPFINPYEEEIPQEGVGSGFVWDKDGHIVTNNHVVAEADEITVRFSDGTEVPAELVGADTDSDLAVIKVNVSADRLQPVRMGDSAQVRVGQLVVSIGSPFGMNNTMTVGFVSALDRTLPVASASTTGGRYQIPEIIQTDAPINPGNSGGVLLNDDGEVIGVPSAIKSTSQASAGIGFAIPSAIVNNVVPALIDDGKYAHAWLGISGTSLVPDLATEMDLDADQRGALVLEVVKDGPADEAGLQGGTREISIDGSKVPVGGDVIVALDKTEILTFDDLIAALSHYNAGEQITLTVLRDGRETQVDVTLGARPANE
ncbi:MAG: trypsin-like peptidase domain-containing protein [Anaerolineae bacterium]|nr:trypsin-like peptidase domain-containing protein [Anaerolineae bacterium]